MKYTVSDDTRRRIHNLYDKGLSMTAIAVAMGWGERGKNKVCGIIRRMRENGISIPMRGSPIHKMNVITPEIEREIVEKLRNNQSARSIADEYGVYVAHVARVRTTNKIPAYRRPQPVRKEPMATIPALAQNVIPFPAPAKPVMQAPVRPHEPERATGSVQCCQYPVGPRLSAVQSYIFCESPVVPGKPYCQEHCAMAYVTPRLRERRSQFVDWRWRVG